MATAEEVPLDNLAETPTMPASQRRRSHRPSAEMLLELTPRSRLWEDAAARQAAGEVESAEMLYRELLESEPESADLCLYHLGESQRSRSRVNSQ